jgi:hypothetical protein
MYITAMTEIDTRPEMYELEHSRDYFSNLHSALNHQMDTLTGEFKYHKPIDDPETGKMELVEIEDRMPLEEIPTHTSRLQYAARKLDKIPASFWEQYSDSKKHREELPWMIMQVWLWGCGNPLSEERQKILYGNTDPERGIFTMQADVYRLLLDPDQAVKGNKKKPDLDEDNAEQAFRIMDSYIRLKQYFGEQGLPEGVTDF